MKMTTKFAALAAALFLISVASAKADSSQTVDYTLTGAETASFAVTIDGPPAFSSPNYFFTATPTNLIVDGVPTDDMLVFFSSADLGGLNSVFSSLPDLAGAQLYSGSTSHPTLLTGVFTLSDLDGTGSYTLTATSAVTSMPEPATLLMLIPGLLAVGMGFKRRLSSSTGAN